MNDLKTIKKEILDIKSDLDDGVDYLSICKVYTDYSIGMIQYIESKRKSVLDSLFRCVADGIRNKLPADQLITVRMNEQLKNYIVARLTSTKETKKTKEKKQPELSIDLSGECREIQFLFNCVKVYQPLPDEQKTEIFNMWDIYEEYPDIQKSFDRLNVRKLYDMFCKIKSILVDRGSHETIYSTIGDHHDVIRYILYYIDEPYESAEFKWRENQRLGWQRAIDSDFVNGIHSQATGSGKSLIALKSINLYNQRYPTHNVMWICERKDIPQKLFFNAIVRCGHGLVTGTPHKRNYHFWKINDIIDMSKFHVVEHLYNKDPSWVQNINSYSGKKPIFLIINRAFMTTKSEKPLRTGKRTIDVQYRYQEIVRMPRFVVIDECHSSMANETYKLLLHLKHNRESKIHGFSATPYRTGKSYTNINITIDTEEDINIKENEKKLIKIFNDPEDPSKLNILSFFNLRDAIEEGVILEPMFHWYYVDSGDTKEGLKKKKAYSTAEQTSVLGIFMSVLKKCTYKKCIVWCGTIAIAEEWKKIFEEQQHKYAILGDMTSYIDHSKTKNNHYDKFYDTPDNCLMFCANKFREGSDIPHLSCCIFMDRVVNRGLIPFIQCIGRVLRKDQMNEKKHGMVLDGCVKDTDHTDVQSIVLKILKYYEYLYEMGDVDQEAEAEGGKLNDCEENVRLFDQMNSSIDTNPKTQTIIIRLRNNKSLKIDVAKLKLSSLEWKKIIPKFTEQLKKRILQNDYMEYLALQQYCRRVHIKDKYYYEREYKCYPDLCVERDGKIEMLDIRARFPGYFKNWYDFLGICTSGSIQQLDGWRRECKTRGITNADQYMKLCEMDGRFPNMPDEFYKGFTNLVSELSGNITNTNKKKVLL